MMKLKSYIDGSLLVGSTRSYRHLECDGGEDHKNRLYITRTASDPRFYVAHCHNCGQSGWYRDRGATIFYPRHVAPSYEKPADNQILLPPSVNRIEDTPAETYLSRYGVTPLSEEEGDELFYDPSDHSIVFAVGEDVTLLGYQKRSLYWKPNLPYPKYTTTKRRDVAHLYKLWERGYASYDCDSGHCLILVEDYISGLKVFKTPTEQAHHGLTWPDVCAMFGCSPSTEMLFEIVKPYTKIGIWLDNETHVLPKAHKISNQIRALGKEPVILTTREGDPKSYTTEEIHTVLTEGDMYVK